MNIRIAMRYLIKSHMNLTLLNINTYMKVVSNWKVTLVGQTW